MSVHVTVRGEGLATNLTGERPLPRVDEHVPVQGAEGGQHLPAEAAVVHLRLTGGVRGVRGRFDLVVTPEMTCKLFVRCHFLLAQRTLEISLFLIKIILQ